MPHYSPWRMYYVVSQITQRLYTARAEWVLAKHVASSRLNLSGSRYQVLEGKNDTQGAIKLLQKVATLEPDNRSVQSDLARLFIKARRDEHNEKEMYQKMLGQAKKMEQKSNIRQKTPLVDNSKVSRKNTHPQRTIFICQMLLTFFQLKLLGFLMGTILIGVAGVAIYRYKYWERGV